LRHFGTNPRHPRLDRQTNVIITTEKKCRKQKIMDVEILTDFGALNGMTGRQMKLLLRILKENEVIEVVPGILQKFSEKRKTLAEYFHSVNADFDVADGQNKQRPIICCKDLAVYSIVYIEYTFLLDGNRNFAFFLLDGN